MLYLPPNSYQNIMFFIFLSPPVHMHGGLICIVFRPSGCDVRKNQTRKKFTSQKVLKLGA